MSIHLILKIDTTWRKTICKNPLKQKEIYHFVFTQPLHDQDVTQGQFLNRENLVWIQNFMLSLPYYLPITVGRRIHAYAKV